MDEEVNVGEAVPGAEEEKEKEEDEVGEMVLADEWDCDATSFVSMR